MSFLVPRRVAKKNAYMEIQAYTKKLLVKRALDLRIQREPSNLAIRHIMPSDVGLRSWVVKNSTIPTYTDYTNFVKSELPGYRLIGIYGITQLSPNPKVNEIIFRKGQTGAATLGIYGLPVLYKPLPILDQLKAILEDPEKLNELISDGIMEGFFTDPHVYDPIDTVYIDVGSGDVEGDFLLLEGFVCEPFGARII